MGSIRQKQRPAGFLSNLSRLYRAWNLPLRWGVYIAWRSFFGRAGGSMAPYVSVSLGYVGVFFVRGGGFGSLCFFWLVLVLVTAAASSVFVRVGFCRRSGFVCFFFFRFGRGPFRWFRLFLFVWVVCFCLFGLVLV